jgi:hypothetical protein
MSEDGLDGRQGTPGEMPMRQASGRRVLLQGGGRRSEAAPRTFIEWNGSSRGSRCDSCSGVGVKRDEVKVE